MKTYSKNIIYLFLTIFHNLNSVSSDDISFLPVTETREMKSSKQILDPFCFEHLYEEIWEPLFSAKINVTDGKLSGFGDYKIDEYEFIKDEMAANGNILFHKMMVTADQYEMKGTILEAFPIAGKGLLHFEIENLSIKSKVYFKQSESGKTLLIDKLENTRFFIDKIKSQTQYDSIFDDILNTWIEELLADYLTRFNKYIAANYSEKLVDIYNSLALMSEETDD